ncbi:MAG TPA: hypothetical protein DCY13_21555 [Verrucomicrobiales bacterium]|nr:hypothetical protein [Verrucomicrobiales bacterium]
MTLLFFLFLALLGFVMKLTAMLTACRGACTGWQFVTSPVLAPNSLARYRPVGDLREVLLRGLVLGSLFAVAHFGCRRVVAEFELQAPVLSYLALPFPLLLGEMLYGLVALLWLPAGFVLPRVFRNPMAARSLADFWGRRWNLWFNDWFRYVIFDRMRSRPVFAIWLVFALSGLMHELVLGVPFLLLTGKNILGIMTLYFLLQGAGVVFEHRMLRGRPAAKRIFVWLVVVGPVPLMLNEALLRVFLLWPE